VNLANRRVLLLTALILAPYGVRAQASDAARHVQFFEEYPRPENLEKLRMLDFDSLVYVAASSLREFEAIRDKIKSINPRVEAGYWPVLATSYWVSPFAAPTELEELTLDLFQSRQARPLKVMLDLELPFLNLKLFYANAFSFAKSKALIQRLFAEAPKFNIELTTAEYPYPNAFLHAMARALGVSYPVDRYPHTPIVMYYSSLLTNEFIQRRIVNYLRGLRASSHEPMELGLGTIATGVQGDEPVLPAAQLAQDLAFARELHVDTVTVFRLGGLTPEYLGVLRKFTR
jgi:hypothetical protein